MKRHVGLVLTLALVLVAVEDGHVDARILRTVLPDLIISTVTAPSSAPSGATIVVSSSIRNQGNASAGAFRVSYYLAPTPSSITGSVLLGFQDVPPFLRALA